MFLYFKKAFEFHEFVNHHLFMSSMLPLYCT